MVKRVQSIQVGDTVRLAVEVVRTDEESITVDVAGRRVTMRRDYHRIEAVEKERTQRQRPGFYDSPD